MLSNELVKQFIKNVYRNNVELNINKLNQAYEFFMENLPNNNKNAAILHQLLDLIDELEILCIKELNNGI